jgi:hypothetical protein
MATPVLPPPGSAENSPISVLFHVHMRAGIRVEPDHDHGLVRLVHAADPAMVYGELAPEGALELALGLIGSTHRLMHPGE